MKMRKIKKKFYRNQIFERKISVMKFIQVKSTLYPLNDRIIFSTDVEPNGSHILYINYVDSLAQKIQIADVTHNKNLPFDKQVEKALCGRIVIVNL